MSVTERPLRLCGDVRFRVVGGEGVVLRQKAGEILVVNEIGAAILTELRRGATLTAIVDALETTFDAPRATIETDVAAFLAELCESGVVETVVDPRPDAL